MILQEILKKKFNRYSNEQLIDLINRKEDFNWDDEGVELNRRRAESKGNFDFKMKGNTLVITKNNK